MKKLFWKSTLLAGMLALAACGGGENNNTDGGTSPDGGTQQSDLVSVSEDITANTTWETGKTYVLEKPIFVKGATLTIQEGVTVQGKAGTALVITNTAKIDAVGTASAPIVMTSSNAAGSRSTGDWGGLVLLGKATTNAGAEQDIEGFTAGAETRYGGSDDAHDCGTVKYVRIEFAGYELSTDNELNGLTVGACGSQTKLDFVQVHLGKDDGIEFFGGTANLKHALVTQPDDDGIDWDLGWRGKGQFIIVQQNADVGNMAFESDNNSSMNDATPRSKPELYNVTLIGSNVAKGTAGKTQAGMHLKNGTSATIRNLIVAYFADGLIDVDGTAVATLLDTHDLTIANALFYKNGDQQMACPADIKDNESYDECAKITGGTEVAFANPQLEAPTNLSAPSFRPNAGSPALMGAATPPAGGFFDTTATFRGAVGSTDWTAGWTAYPAN